MSVSDILDHLCAPETLFLEMALSFGDFSRLYVRSVRTFAGSTAKAVETELDRDPLYPMMGKVAWVAGADRREAPGPKPARLGPTPQVGFPPIRLRRQPPGSSQLWNGGVQRGVSVFPARFRTGSPEVTTCQRLTLQTLRANWLRFSGSIPPLVNLSHNMPTINTTGKLAS